MKILREIDWNYVIILLACLWATWEFARASEPEYKPHLSSSGRPELCMWPKDMGGCE